MDKLGQVSIYFVVSKDVPTEEKQIIGKIKKSIKFYMWTTSAVAKKNQINATCKQKNHWIQKFIMINAR